MYDMFKDINLNPQLHVLRIEHLFPNTKVSGTDLDTVCSLPLCGETVRPPPDVLEGRHPAWLVNRMAHGG